MRYITIAIILHHILLADTTTHTGLALSGYNNLNQEILSITTNQILSASIYDYVITNAQTLQEKIAQSKHEDTTEENK